MQLILNIDELGYSLLVEVLSSFHMELCMFGFALICWKVLHRGYLDELRKSKASPSKRVVRSASPAVCPVDAPAERDFSDLIKACGQSNDVEQARGLWREFTAQLAPDAPNGTQTVFATMVEALVANGCIAEAWDVVKQMRQDNPKLLHFCSVYIYSTLLRGFAKTQEHKEVCALYAEMQEQTVPMNTISYNMVLNSFARRGRMHQIPEFLETMKAEGPRGAPDIVTFATIIKGYCHTGNLDGALKLFDVMMQMKIKPDEFTFNSILDGCAKERRHKEATHLLEVMQEHKVPPSNYTLSIAVKVLGRMHRLGQAFAMAEEVRSSYGIQPNIQVYTCLMQACFQGRRIRKALDLYNQVVAENVVLVDTKTYTVMAIGCLNNGVLDKAVMVLRAAYHLPGSGILVVPQGRPQGVSGDCLKKVLSELRWARPADAEALEAELRVGALSP